jgi:SEA/GATOR complex protein SEA2/WDR24
VPLSKLKALGNKPFKPVVQSVGTHVFDPSHQDLNRLSILAKRYVVDGPDKVTICEINAQIALEAEHYQVFQMWCLLRSLFSPAPASPRMSRPPTPPLSPLSLSSRVLPHSRSAPAAIMTSSSLLPPDTPKGLSSDTILNPHTPYPTSGDSPHLVSSASSNSPSPRNVSNTAQVNSSPQSALSTPSTTSAHSPTIFSRHPSNAAFLASRPRAYSSIRRPSVSTPSLVPGDNSTSPSLRHIGEGTLDDSDSSGSESELSSLPSGSVLSPTAQPLSRAAHSIAHPHPSPLSRIAAAGQQTWAEDERDVDDDSPSPASTETESDGEIAPMRTRTRSQSLRRRAARRSSHSATRVAPGPTQPAPIPAQAHVLARPSSRSSMRTVTAHDDGDHEPFLPSAQLTNASRVTSVAMSLSDGLFGSGKDSDGDDAALTQNVYVRNRVHRRIEDVRDAICCALREALDERAEAGDVQTCAMVALVASGVLRIGTQRVQLFVEAYIGMSPSSQRCSPSFVNDFAFIELLMRMKLYITAAYLRKHSALPEIRSATNVRNPPLIDRPIRTMAHFIFSQLQTTVYMSCGRCGKPILAQQGGSMCATCRSPAAQCSIWYVSLLISPFYDRLSFR